MHLALIEDTKYELTTLFEHGLANSARFAERFDELAAQFGRTGMGYASEKLGLLAGKLKSSGFEVDAGTTELFALIWEYMAIATDRLQYLQAKRSIAKRDS